MTEELKAKLEAIESLSAKRKMMMRGLSPGMVELVASFIRINREIEQLKATIGKNER